MIRRLYDLEDWLFYASVRMSPARRRRFEHLSQRIGQLADRLDAEMSSLRRRLGQLVNPTSA